MTSDRLLGRDRSVLCVVDIQEKLVAAMPQRDDVLANTRRLIAGALRLDVPILVTEQYPKGLGPTYPEIREALGAAYAPIEKMTFACCGEPGYMQRLTALGRRQVVLCGMETHVCVLQTCLILLDEGYDVCVVADAVCSRNAEHKALALDQMRQMGVIVASAESVLFQWLERAGTSEFKDISRLVR